MTKQDRINYQAEWRKRNPEYMKNYAKGFPPITIKKDEIRERLDVENKIIASHRSGLFSNDEQSQLI